MGAKLATEAERYLAVVEAFAALGADPHVHARAKADKARAEERDLAAAVARRRARR